MAGSAAIPPPGDAEEPTVYAVRFTPQAIREMIAAGEYLGKQTGDPETARLWVLGMREESARLATFPRRFQVQPQESRRLGVPAMEVRRILYRRSGVGTSSSVAGYHLYYLVEDDSPDGPLVRVFHVRHAARRPITPAEGRAIREEL